MLSFQEIILKLETFWSQQGCVILQPYDMEMGAGTFHTATTLKALGPDFWWAAFVQPSRRPTDGRYGEHPNRMQKYHQYQVILKPTPPNPQELYLESLKVLGIHSNEHDIRFVEDDWESPTLGAAGMGWEVWCDGMEISQFTYFQQMGGIACQPVPVELTYGLERIAMFIQGVSNVYDLSWNGQTGEKKITYRDVWYQLEKQFSEYNFEASDPAILLRHFQDSEVVCQDLLQKKLVLPAYEHCIKASNIFNLLEARGVISVTERAGYISRIRSLAKGCCEAWLESTASHPSEG